MTNSIIVPLKGICATRRSDGWYYCLLPAVEPYRIKGIKDEAYTGPFASFTDMLASVPACSTCQGD